MLVSVAIISPGHRRSEILARVGGEGDLPLDYQICCIYRLKPTDGSLSSLYCSNKPSIQTIWITSYISADEGFCLSDARQSVLLCLSCTAKGLIQQACASPYADLLFLGCFYCMDRAFSLLALVFSYTLKIPAVLTPKWKKACSLISSLLSSHPEKSTWILVLRDKI